jgi:biotin carboxyl carrier protein
MADELNGAPDPRGRALRVTFASGSAPSAPIPRNSQNAQNTPSDAATSGHGTTAVVELDGVGRVTVGGTHPAAVLTDLGRPRARLVLTEGAGVEDHQVLVTPLRDARQAAMGVRRLEVVVDGWRFELDVDSEARARLRERATSARADAARGGPSELRAIIPGRVVSVEVAEGDAVEAGGRLLVLEAMKMQNELKAPRAGTVARVAVGAGQTVELGDLLLVIE